MNKPSQNVAMAYKAIDICIAISYNFTIKGANAPYDSCAHMSKISFFTL